MVEMKGEGAYYASGDISCSDVDFKETVDMKPTDVDSINFIWGYGDNNTLSG